MGEEKLMPNLSFDQLPEVFVSNRDVTVLVSREMKKSRLRKLSTLRYFFTKRIIGTRSYLTDYQLFMIKIFYSGNC